MRFNSIDVCCRLPPYGHQSKYIARYTWESPRDHHPLEWVWQRNQLPRWGLTPQQMCLNRLLFPAKLLPISINLESGKHLFKNASQEVDHASYCLRSEILLPVKVLQAFERNESQFYRKGSRFPPELFDEKSFADDWRLQNASSGTLSLRNNVPCGNVTKEGSVL